MPHIICHRVPESNLCVSDWSRQKSSLILQLNEVEMKPSSIDNTDNQVMNQPRLETIINITVKQ